VIRLRDSNDFEMVEEVDKNN